MTSSTATVNGFLPEELSKFERDGYIVARQLAPPSLVAAIRARAEADLANRVEPFELEADLRYPGAPPSRDAEGGLAIRRLRRAYGRDPVFDEWLQSPALGTRLRQLLGPRVLMPQAHHNCIMTKQPRYSSDSLWHQDIRYWRYTRRELVTAWLALGHEYERNGGLQVIPGSHKLELDRDRFDDALFFRTDLPINQPLLEQRVPLELAPGDVLFFHCRLLHAATRNYEDQTKLALVFTFRSPDDTPVPGTRSASLPDVELAHTGAPAPV